MNACNADKNDVISNHKVIGGHSLQLKYIFIYSNFNIKIVYYAWFYSNIYSLFILRIKIQYENANEKQSITRRYV